LLFSPHCILCKASDGGRLGICDACTKALPWHADYCPQCALPSIQSQLCGDCLTSPPDFDDTQALFRYAFPINAMLQQYKYGQAMYLAETLATLIVEQLNLDARARLLPMPLHPDRLQVRGFNQSLEIARLISQKTGMNFDYTSCQRVKSSPPQASLSLKERVMNMRNAFSCTQNLAGQHILLLDDVMTTGATLNSLAKTVKQAGAAKVSCIVAARTL
jgi:ComF family protein